MGETRPVRVVVVRRGQVRTAEFALRRGEVGLSMFTCGSDEDVRIVVEAVRAAGKTGALGAAALTEVDIVALGLVLVPTPGGTPDPRVNDMHVEARLTQALTETARRLGQEPWELFNQQIAAALRARARVIYEG